MFRRGEIGHHPRHDVRKLVFVHTFSTGQVVYKRIHTAARDRRFASVKGSGREGTRSA